MAKKKLRHRDAHCVLHANLDELAADYLRHHPGVLLGETTVMALITWSAKETEHPTQEK